MFVDVLFPRAGSAAARTYEMAADLGAVQRGYSAEMKVEEGPTACLWLPATVHRWWR